MCPTLASVNSGPPAGDANLSEPAAGQRGVVAVKNDLVFSGREIHPAGKDQT
jgi:hypothetical protein